MNVNMPVIKYIKREIKEKPLRGLVWRVRRWSVKGRENTLLAIEKLLLLIKWDLLLIKYIMLLKLKSSKLVLKLLLLLLAD